MSGVYKLRLGPNQVTLDSELTAVATLRRHGMEWRILVTIEGEDCGGHADNTHDGCEVWFAGWLNGWTAARRLTARSLPRAGGARG